MIRNLIDIQVAREIIFSLQPVFYSHDFIDAFQNHPQHQEEYRAIVERYTEDADRKANSLIARFLSDNTDILPIEKIGRGYTPNVHGNKTSCAIWKRN